MPEGTPERSSLDGQLLSAACPNTHFWKGSFHKGLSLSSRLLRHTSLINRGTLPLRPDLASESFSDRRSMDPAPATYAWHAGLNPP